MCKAMCFINDSIESFNLSMETYKSYIFQIKNIFLQNTGSTIIGLILCANTPGKDDSHETFPFICNRVREHIWRDSWPIVYAELFIIIDILGIPPSSVQTTGSSWDLSLETIAKHGCIYVAISVLIFMDVWSHCPAVQFTYDQVCFLAEAPRFFVQIWASILTGRHKCKKAFH